MADNWIEWNGGECPVPADALVEVKLRDTKIQGPWRGHADAWVWGHTDEDDDIVAYRVVSDLTETPKPDSVNRPAHYTAGSVECIDAIEAALTPEEFRGYCKGNALKYVWRERMKGGDESLAKAQWYLERLEGKK